MDPEDEKIREAVRHTDILRWPKQSLATFGMTSIYYYLVTEPAYADLVKNVTETVVREGRIIAEKPRVVTPYYLSRTEGFSSEARRYFELLTSKHGPSVPGLFYTYRNETKELNIVSDNLHSVVDKLNAEIDKRGDPLISIIKGQDELWDVSLMKFIYEITESSMRNNVMQMGARGLLDIDAHGIPMDARISLEELFSKVARGEGDPSELKNELDRWNVFEEYEDRFFALFQKR